MSQANLPNITPTIDITREDAINLIIASIAMEELGLSHILNAEGEKLQYVLGTLPGVSAPAVTLSDLLAVNDSIRKTLKETTRKDWVLSNKLEMALCASEDPKGPTGPTCVEYIPPLCGGPIRCLPINYDGPVPCVDIPNGPTCFPVPNPNCTLIAGPEGYTCVSEDQVQAIVSAMPGC
ncbi:hypothetical protein [Paenibacillus jiagnxiensis]|uniref:hypothetical protein n=1 Tax=Paenibacillus jiagnxiensis TaxID=3228926 RepID=UPI0033B3EF00